MADERKRERSSTMTIPEFISGSASTVVNPHPDTQPVPSDMISESTEGSASTVVNPQPDTQPVPNEMIATKRQKRLAGNTHASTRATTSIERQGDIVSDDWLARFLRTFPDDLMYTVLFMLPIPFFIMACLASKTWRSRLSPIAAQDDGHLADDDDNYEKRFVTCFREAARERSESQDMLYPVVFGTKHSAAFDWSSKSWIRVPSLAFLPRDLLVWAKVPYLTGNGGAVFVTSIGPNADEIIVVANYFTQSWKRLPPCPPHVGSGRPIRYRLHSPRLFWDSPTGPSKVVAFSFRLGSRYADMSHDASWYLNVYDFESHTWSVTNIWGTKLPALSTNVAQPPWDAILRRYDSAYLNGVLYMKTVFMDLLFTFDMNNGTHAVSGLGNRHQTRLLVAASKLLVWKDRLFMVHFYSYKVKVNIWELHFDTRSNTGRRVKVCNGPPEPFTEGLAMIRYGTCQNDRIIFDGFSAPHKRKSKIVVYNLLTQTWRCEEGPLALAASFFYEGPPHESSVDSAWCFRDVTFRADLDPCWKV